MEDKYSTLVYYNNYSHISDKDYDPILKAWVKSTYVLVNLPVELQRYIMSYFINPITDIRISLQKVQYSDVIERGRFFFDEFMFELISKYNNSEEEKKINGIVPDLIISSNKIFNIISKIDNPLLLIENDSYSIFLGRPFIVELGLKTKHIKNYLDSIT